jgi:hypothetical protein
MSPCKGARFRAIADLYMLAPPPRRKGHHAGETRMSTSRSFTVIGLALLLWNLIGVAAFIMQYTADLATLAKSDAYTARIFAVAVGAGTLGAVMLLMRRAVAAPLFGLSVIGVAVQFGYSFFGTDLLTVKGTGAAVFPAVILAVAVGQMLYAGRKRAKGLLR